MPPPSDWRGHVPVRFLFLSSAHVSDWALRPSYLLSRLGSSPPRQFGLLARKRSWSERAEQFFIDGRSQHREIEARFVDLMKLVEYRTGPNYGGSAGYGREYRERLLGQWGVVDVNDCCSCATFLVETGRVDAQRLCVTGESAGGFTTLACLAFRQTFKAGSSLYGIADLASLRAGMHKFEAYYIDNLVGNKQAYFERSPINFVERFTCPVILFQGLEDPVVSPDQATTIYKAIKDKGLPVALVEYEGEQHGFRKGENIKFTLEQQMMFFARLVGHFKVADNITPIKLDNFDEASL